MLLTSLIPARKNFHDDIVKTSLIRGNRYNYIGFAVFFNCVSKVHIETCMTAGIMEVGHLKIMLAACSSVATLCRKFTEL